MDNKTQIRNWSPKRPGYWKLYHQSHEHDAEEVFKAISWLVKGVGPPWKVSPSGRPPKISPEEYASLCVFKRWYDLVMLVVVVQYLEIYFKVLKLLKKVTY